MSDDELDLAFQMQEATEDIDHIDPFKRTGHIAFKYCHSMVVWGGYISDNNINHIRYHPTTELWIYNPIVEKWSSKRTNPTNAPATGRSGASGLLHNHCLYIFGGYTSIKRSNKANDVYSLNLIDLNWTRYEAAGIKPLACDKMVSWVYLNKLFYFGGFGHTWKDCTELSKLFDFCNDDTVPGKGWNNQLVAYDIVTNTWMWPKCKGVAPVPRAAHACVKINSKVYIFGGRHEEFRLNDLHCLDLETMSWSGNLMTTGDIPTGRSWHTLTKVSEQLVVLYGGLSNQREALSDCWLLHLNDMSWEKISLPFVKSRVWHTACESDPGEVLIFGGCCGNILNPIMPPHAEGIISLWFSPKSLLRSCVDVIVNNKELLEPHWLMLPSTLAEILRLKSNHKRGGGSFCRNRLTEF